ncbi:MAG: response regulator [Pseudomonadota bacterium]
MLPRAVDRLLPPSFRSDSSDERRRAELLLVALVMVILVALPTSALLSLMGLIPEATLVVAGVVPTVLVLPLLHLSRSVSLATHVLAALIFVQIAGSLNETNQFAMPTLLALPIITTFIAGPHQGLLWSVGIALYCAADALALSPSGESGQFGLAWTTSIMSLAIGGAAYIVERSRQRAAENEAAANRRLLKYQSRDAEIQRLQGMAKIASGAAHDYNNLLMIVSGYAEALPPGDEQQGILSAVEAAKDLTGQLLALGRASNPLATARPPRIELGTVLTEQMPQLRMAAPRNPLHILEEVTEPCRVEIRPSELLQILLNLITNAADASTPGEPIVFRWRHRQLTVDEASAVGINAGHYAVLSVVDRGVGLSAIAQQNAFEPFFSTKPLDQGSGLGLASSHAIATTHRGALALANNEDRGCCAQLFLPCFGVPIGNEETMDESEPVTVAKPTPLDLEANPEPAKIDGLSRAGYTGRVILIEDEDKVRDVVASHLEADGYQVSQAASAEEAMAFLDQQAPDLLVSDVRLPHMSGTEFATLARARYPSLPTLLISGSGQPTAPEVGVHFLSKPFRLGQLRAAIEDLRAAG